MCSALRLPLLAAAVALVAACSPAQKEEMRVRLNLVDPVVVSDASVAGQTVALDNGQALVVRLGETFSPDYRWRLRLVNDGILNAAVQRDFTSVYSPGRIADDMMISPGAAVPPAAGEKTTTTYALPASAAVAGAVAPPAPDTPGEVTFRMRGINPGQTPVVMEYHRIGDSAPQKTVAFNVVVR